MYYILLRMQNGSRNTERIFEGVQKQVFAILLKMYKNLFLYSDTEYKY